MNILGYLLLLLSLGMISYYFTPLVINKIQEREEVKIKKASKELEKMFVSIPLRKLKILSLGAVLVGAFAGFIFFRFIGAAAGAFLGFSFPYFLVRFKKKKRKAMFAGQLVDAINILNGGLKAGLSFNQSLDMVISDMAAPISDEFSLVSREIRMGSSLEEALVNLDQRMDIEELRFVVAAILVAREVGGDLPSVLSQLVDTLRDRFRLKENIKTYTLQGRAQAYIISLIPIVFLFVVLQRNPRHFDIMLNSEIGRIFLVVAALLNIVGIFLIVKMSKMNI